MLVVAVFPCCAEVTGPVVIVCSPSARLVTLTLMVHDPDAGINPPARVNVWLLPVDVKVAPHVFDNPFGVASVSPPAGRFTVTETLIPAAFGLVIVKFSGTVAFSGMVALLKDAVMEGAGSATVTVADAVELGSA